MQLYLDPTAMPAPGPWDFTITPSGTLLQLGSPSLLIQKDITSDYQPMPIHLHGNGNNSVDTSEEIYSGIANYEDGKCLLVCADRPNNIEIYDWQLEESNMVEKMGSRIVYMAVSKSGDLVALAFENKRIQVHNFKKNKVIKFTQQHSQQIVSLFWSPNEKYLCSIGLDNMIYIWTLTANQKKEPIYNSILKDQIDLRDSQNKNKRPISGMFNYTSDEIACGGFQNLQLFVKSNKKPANTSFYRHFMNQGEQEKQREFTYSSVTNIEHDEPILFCHWINQQRMVTAAEDLSVKIWNIGGTVSEMYRIDGIGLTKIMGYGISFFGIDVRGRVYKLKENHGIDMGKMIVQEQIMEKEGEMFEEQRENGNENSRNEHSRSKEILSNKLNTIRQVSMKQEDEQLSEYVSVQQSSQNINQNSPQIIDSNDQSDKQNQNVDVNENPWGNCELKPLDIKPRADRMINCYPQAPITTTTQFFNNSRYLFYNTVGCIIERKNDDNICIFDVDYHDGKIPKREFDFGIQGVVFFDIAHNKLIFANDKEIGFFGEQKKWRRKLHFEGEEIQGIKIGNQWLAVAMESNILTFDLVGNMLSNISFDKKFVAMAAYENLLAIVYVDSVPLYKNQNIRMNVWNVNGVHNPIESSVLSIRPQSTLIAFGFSDEGVLYCQDSKQCVKVFSMEDKKWIQVYTPKSFVAANINWVIGMSQYELLAFILPFGQKEPTVLPKMYPRKVLLSINCRVKYDPKKPETNQNLSDTFGILMWKKFTLDHQRYRLKTWYRYKFSKENQKSKCCSILTEQEIDAKESLLLQQMMLIVKDLALQGDADSAYITAKTFITTQKQIKKVILLFDQAGLSSYSTRLQNQFSQYQRSLNFDSARNLKFKQLQQQIQKNINLVPTEPTKTQIKPTVSSMKSITNKPTLRKPNVSVSGGQRPPIFIPTQTTIRRTESGMNQEKEEFHRPSSHFQWKRMGVMGGDKSGTGDKEKEKKE